METRWIYVARQFNALGPTFLEVRLKIRLFFLEPVCSSDQVVPLLNYSSLIIVVDIVKVSVVASATSDPLVKGTNSALFPLK